MSERVRRENNAARALALLQAKGAAGATNAELIQVAGYRYGARLLELRRAWDIESRHERDGLWRFTLRGPREWSQPELFGA